MNTTSTTDGQPTVTWVLEAKFKELTDEEILEVFDREVGLNSACGWEIDFARAILRKAQEK
jgi:hypothetical protein